MAVIDGRIFFFGVGDYYGRGVQEGESISRLNYTRMFRVRSVWGPTSPWQLVAHRNNQM